ncbi:MAG: MBL fold metallo-hydrolase [Gemmatimonadota bacterium]|nr:MBL fold metallo-hydrolase [Gemmatimonadota bacterium]
MPPRTERAGASGPRVLVAPNPGPLTLDGTRTYVVGVRRVVVIDPGPDDDGHLAEILEATAGRPVLAILLTHAHADHAGGAAGAAAALEAPILASAVTLERAGLAGRALEDGEEVPLGPNGGELVALATPGHASDHFAFLKRPERWLFTGDLVLGEGSSAVLHPDGAVGPYLASLRRLEALRPTLLLPGHGPSVEDAPGRLRAYHAHRLERERQVEEAIVAGAATPAEIRERVYGPLPPGLVAAAEASVSAHLAHLRGRGIDAPPPGPGLDEEDAHGRDA